ncbi:RimK/LysX family protein [Vibrio sp. Isolate24]|uniref:putative ATP-dependent zinc protease n=1 Tax=Vibrio sp. Isolate24 TaxID=2908534 RepID=UPI001EFD1E10|nr:RimK/LysX family protein [Vibrio sp. Isolate24]MCG9679338.1 RimK/LysX family protein [Vibrio sp. Isolate24]
MKKLSLFLTLTSVLLTTPHAWSESLSATTQQPAYQVDNDLILGRIENVYYNDIPELKDVPFMGKIDTGADTTSIHAENIHLSSTHPDFKHLTDNDLLWAVVNDRRKKKLKRTTETYLSYQVTIAFTIRHPYTGENINIKDDLERISIIRSRTSKKPILRPAVKMPLTIGGRTVEAMINLTKRSQFSAPILIGKTFLEDNAWVMAGYDYLQEQPHAQVIGKKETVQVDGLPYKVSVATTSRYSNAHALDVNIDKKNNLVSFKLEGENGERKSMTLPLIRTLKTSEAERPLVYLPVKLNQDQTQHWLVYLRDRGHLDSQISLGRDVASEHFVINTEKANLLQDADTSFKSALKSDPLVISPKETITIDQDYQLPAHPSFVVKTPLLRVTEFKLSNKNGKEQVSFILENSQGEMKTVSKRVLRKLKVGKSVRPVVEGVFELGDKKRELEFAIDKLGKGDAQPFFVMGHSMAKNGVLLNTRTENLLTPHPLFKAGYIEVAQVEELSFPVKLDTGADVSSINAQNIKQFQKNGKDMVTFTYENDVGMKQEFTREVVDVMRIKAKKGEKDNVRPVVEMRVRLGEIDQTIRVNLQDRGRFHYSMILGENFLKYGAIVSSDQAYIVTDEPDYEK